MPNFNKSKGFKLKSGNNPFQKNFPGAFKQSARSVRKAEESEARGDSAGISDNLLNVLEHWGDGGEYDVSGDVYAAQDRAARKASDASILDTTMHGGANLEWDESRNDFVPKEGEVDRIRAAHEARIAQYANEPSDSLAGEYAASDLEAYEQSIKDQQLALGTGGDDPGIYMGTKGRGGEYAEGDYGSGASQIALLEAERQGDLVRHQAGEDAIGRIIESRQKSHADAVKTREKQAEAEARALESDKRQLENAGLLEFGKKKELKEKIAAAEGGDSPMEKSGFKMKGSYHYGKKKKV